MLPPPGKRWWRKTGPKTRISIPVSALHEWGLPLARVASHRCPAKHGHWSAEADGIEERNCQLFGHPYTAVRRGIAWQISGMHPIRAVESHEIMHRSGNKFASGWH